MKKFKHIILFLAVTAVLSSCSDNDFVENGKYMKLCVNMENQNTSRAMVTSTTFPSGATLGIWLKRSDGGDYMGTPYNNYKYTASGSGASQNWICENQISLSSTVGQVFAMYPYTSGATSYTNVPIESASQTDYMYSGAVTGISSSNVTANPTMKHALSCIRLQLKKNTYSGAGVISKLSVSGNCLAANATMNLANGATVCTNVNSEISRSVNVTLLPDSYQSIDILAIPTGSASPINFKLEVDGKVFPLMTTSIAPVAGSIHSFHVDVDDPKVTEGDWETTSLSVSASPSYYIASTGGYVTLSAIAHQERTVTTLTQGIETTKTVTQDINVTPSWSSRGTGSLNDPTLPNPTFTMGNNTTTAQRTGVVSATYGGQTGDVTITQEAGSETTVYGEWSTSYLTVSASPTSIASTGGGSTLKAVASESRIIYTKVNGWIASQTSESRARDVSGSVSWSGSSTGFSRSGVDVTVVENTTAYQRSVKYTATIDGVSDNVTITQDAATIGVVYVFELTSGNPSNLVDSAAGSISYTVKSQKTTTINGNSTSPEDVDYSASAPSWITPGKTSASYEENATGSTRSGVITLTQNGSGKTITINIGQKKKTSVDVEE